MTRPAPAIFLAITALIAAALPATLRAAEQAEERIVFTSPAPSAPPSLPQTPLPLPEDDRQFRTRALVAGGVLGVAWYGAAHWWKHGTSSHFATVNEGWFGQDTYAGGADKLGHMYSTYVGTRLLARGFEWAGNDPDRALSLAALTSFGAMSAVEIMDGFSERYRFSKEDFVMNALGTGLAVLLEKYPGLDEVLDFRLRYWPSDDARRLNQVDIVDDHSGQTYLLAIKASGFPALRKIEPLRYLELAVGYGSRGYEPRDDTEHSRHVYYGVSLNVAEILKATVFKDRKSGRAEKITNGILEVVQIPGTAALADHRI